MYTDLTDAEIDTLNEFFKRDLDPDFDFSHHGNGVIKFFNSCKSLHNKGYIRITPSYLLEMTAEEWADSNKSLHYDPLDKIKPLYDEYKKNHTS